MKLTEKIKEHNFLTVFLLRFVGGLDENILDLLIGSGANVNKMDHMKQCITFN